MNFVGIMFSERFRDNFGALISKLLSDFSCGQVFQLLEILDL